MVLTTPMAMAYRTDAPADKAALVPAAAPAGEVPAAEELAVDCPRAVVASTRRSEHPSVPRAKSCTHSWFILASGIW